MINNEGILSLDGKLEFLLLTSSNVFSSEQHCWAMFCMLQCGTEVQNTDLVMVDKMLTDICFEDPIIL